MPWKETAIVESRYAFILDIQSGLSHSEACRAHGIDRKTGRKWRQRYASAGLEGLKDQSRASHQHPNQTSQDVVDALVALRREHPSWGAKKIVELLAPPLVAPARSTVNEILHRHGLLQPRKARARPASYDSPLAGYHGPNAVWCMDFKGTMTIGKKRTDPFTVSDGVSRFLIRINDLSANRTGNVKRCLKAAFNEYGIPDAMRSDNGPPFATLGLAGLGALSVWLIKLGVVPERIRPGCPTENGRHERIHRTLEDDIETHCHGRPSLQTTLDRFRQSYNHVRPHESLEMKTPAQIYQPSLKMYPTKLRDPRYDGAYRCERIGRKGELFWNGNSYYLSKALAKELVGIDCGSGANPTLYFGPIKLGKISNGRFRPTPRKRSKKPGTTKTNT